MNIFNAIPLLRPKRNTFNLSFENKLTTDFFRLTPFVCKEALPDDVWHIRPEIFARVSPMLAPVMHRLNIRAYFFFVPTRIIWDEFEKWINPKSGVSNIVAPRFDISGQGFGNLAPKSLADYLGVNVGLNFEDQSSFAKFLAGATTIFSGTSLEISELPFRAYQQIFNDWFIDLNNTDEVEFSKGSGVTDVETFHAGPAYLDLFKLRYRAWEHDYLTSAMPEPQRGPDVNAFDGVGADSLSLESNGNVQVTGMSLPALNVDLYGIEYNGETYSSVDDMVANFADFGFESAAQFAAANNIVLDGDHYHWNLLYGTGATGTQSGHVVARDIDHKDFGVTIIVRDSSTNKVSVAQANTHTHPTIISGTSPIFTIQGSDIANSLKISANGNTGVTVEELRVRMQMQAFLERNEVGGSRYTEMLYAHWGVKDPDGRLQRAEFIGGCKQPIMINDISQTSAPTDDDPLGQWAGQGMSSSMGKTLKYHCPEHGFIVGLLCVMPRSGYFQGLNKMFKRFDRLDYYFPSFAHLGEQEVKNYEVLNSGFDPEGTFGYQSRYAEYKASLDEVHGDFKGNLAFYHGARAFDTPASAADLPKLSDYFTTPQSEHSDDIDRIFPVLNSENPWFNADHFLIDVYNHLTVSRRMPKFVTPRNGS